MVCDFGARMVCDFDVSYLQFIQVVFLFYFCSNVFTAHVRVWFVIYFGFLVGVRERIAVCTDGFLVLICF
jgi:hypothetical protein